MPNPSKQQKFWTPLEINTRESIHGQTDGWMDGQTDGRYQTYYLPCFAVDNNFQGVLIIEVKGVRSLLKYFGWAREYVLPLRKYLSQYLLKWPWNPMAWAIFIAFLQLRGAPTPDPHNCLIQNFFYMCWWRPLPASGVFLPHNVCNLPTPMGHHAIRIHGQGFECCVQGLQIPWIL